MASRSICRSLLARNPLPGGRSRLDIVPPPLKPEQEPANKNKQGVGSGKNGKKRVERREGMKKGARKGAREKRGAVKEQPQYRFTTFASRLLLMISPDPGNTPRNTSPPNKSDNSAARFVPAITSKFFPISLSADLPLPHWYPYVSVSLAGVAEENEGGRIGE